MRDAFSLIDLILKELRRQQRASHLKVRNPATGKPDTVMVNGTLDLYELAKAVNEA